MKTEKKIIIVFFLVFSLGFSNLCLSQTYNKDEEETQTNTEINGTSISPEVFASFGFDNSVNPRSATLQGNSVFITQIGQTNNAAIFTETNASEINLLQNGDFNNVNLAYSTNTAIADLEQNGNENTIIDFVNEPEADVSLDLKQNGNGLNFERNGVNSITKSLKFTQTEASPTLIIRSYK